MTRASLFIVAILTFIAVAAMGAGGWWGDSPVPLVLCVIAFFVLLRFTNPYR